MDYEFLSLSNRFDSTTMCSYRFIRIGLYKPVSIQEMTGKVVNDIIPLFSKEPGYSFVTLINDLPASYIYGESEAQQCLFILKPDLFEINGNKSNRYTLSETYILKPGFIESVYKMLIRSN